MNDHLDGFDHRGTGATGRTNMLNGVYSEVTASWEPSTANPRSGANAMHMATAAITRSVIRRFYKTQGFKKFLGHAWYIPALPDQSYRWCFCQFLTSSNIPIVSFTLSTTGQLQILIGDTASASGGEVVAAEGEAGDFVPGIYQHVECMGFVNGASSSAEVRVNGVVAASVSGIDLGSTPIAQWTIGRTRTNNDGVNNVDVDDQRAGDDLGGVNDDFMGDKAVHTDMADADGPIQEFTPSSGGDAFAMVDEIPPDGDTTHVESTTPGNLCQITFPDLPAGVASVLGIAYEVSARKTDIGPADLAINVVSGAERELGQEQALNLAYEYLPLQCFDEDPEINAPWQPASVNASICELEHAATS